MSTKKLQIVTPIVTSVNGETGDVTIDLDKNKVTVDSSLSDTSTNPVQNKAIYNKLVEIDPLVIIVDYDERNGAYTPNKDINFSTVLYYAAERGKFTLILRTITTNNSEEVTTFTNWSCDLASNIIMGTGISDTGVIYYVYGQKNLDNSKTLWSSGITEGRTLPNWNNEGEFLRIVNGMPAWQSLTNVAEEGA